MSYRNLAGGGENSGRFVQPLLNRAVFIISCYNGFVTCLDLQRKLDDKPFRPFRIRLINNTVYDVLEPWVVTVGESSAVIVTQMRKDDHGYETALDWRTVSISHMLEFSEIETKERTRRRNPA